jgi:hypothetical protein
MEKSSWAAFSAVGLARRQPRPISSYEASLRLLLPRDAAKWTPVPHGPHLLASLLHGQETATHPTRYRAHYHSNPSPFLCSGFAPLTGAIPVGRPPSSRAPAPPR